MKKRIIHIIFTLALCINSLQAIAQTFPVQVIPQVTPPPPVYLSDYANAANTVDKIKATILLTDLTVSNRQVRLKLYIEGNGIDTQSRDFVIGAQPIFLDGGIPVQLGTLDLAPYFELQNLQGISAGAYANTLPEGLYQFCFEVYDVLSGNLISRKSCANVLIFLNEPPFLNLPQNNINLEAMNPQNLLFQWTPRHINVTNVEYEFSLVEIWDFTMDPQAVFLASPPIYQTTTQATSFLYGIAEPQLLEGKRYAWRVRAKAKDGIDEIGLFSNNGFSEIFAFTYQGECAEPTYLSVEEVGTKIATFRWQGDIDNLNYRIGYRKAMDADGNTGEANSFQWFENDTSREEYMVIDLEPDTMYEWRVGGYCAEGTLTYAPTTTFTTMNVDAEAYYNCGIEPTIDIANQTLLETIQVGDVIKAGDFNVKIQEVDGTNSFSGKGYTTVGFLKNIKIALVFTNIQVNTSYQFVSGEIKTLYDPTWSNILDIDAVIDVIEDITDVFNGNDRDHFIQLDYDIDLDDIRIDSDSGQIIITDPSGEEHTYDYDTSDVYTISDVNGEEFTINPDGSITNTGQAAEGGPATAANTYGITDSGDHNVQNPSVVSIGKHPITFVYETSGNTKYGLDKADNTLELDQYHKVEIEDGGNYYPIHKAVQELEAQDTFIVKVINSSNYIKTDSLIFKTVSGRKIDAIKNGDDFTVTVKGKNSYLNEEAIITYKDSTGMQHVLSSFFIHHTKKLPIIDVNVVLLNGADAISDLEGKLNNIYKQAGVTVNINETSEFRVDESVWDIENNNGLIDITDNSFLESAIPDELKAIKNYYTQENPGYDKKMYYLFVIGDEITIADGDIMGIMAPKTQWGYIFESNYKAKGKDPAIIAAHELGHGVFDLEHPFKKEKTKIGIAETWLMDYKSNTELAYPSWVQISSDALNLGLFSDTQDSQNSVINGLPDEFQNGDRTYTFLTLNGSFITLPENVRKLRFVSGVDHINTHTRYATGALIGFRLDEEDFYADAYGELSGENIKAEDFNFNYKGFVSKKTNKLYGEEDDKEEKKKYHGTIIIYKVDYGVKRLQKLEVDNLAFVENSDINILSENGYTKLKKLYYITPRQETTISYAKETPYDEGYKLNEELIGDFIGNETNWTDKYLIISKLALLNNSYPILTKEYISAKFSGISSSDAHLIFKQKEIDELKELYIELINYVKLKTNKCKDNLNNLDNYSSSDDIVNCIKSLSDDEIKEVLVDKKILATSILLEDIRVNNEEEIQLVRLLKFTERRDIDDLFLKLKGKSKVDSSKFILKELVKSVDNDHTWTSDDNYLGLLQAFTELALKSETFKQLAISYNDDLFTERNINFYHKSFWDNVKELGGLGLNNYFPYTVSNPETEVSWLSEESVSLQIQNKLSSNFYLELDLTEPLETEPFAPIWFVNKSSLSMLSDYNKNEPVLSPALLAYYANDVGGTQKNIDGINAAVDVASLASGYGALLKGPSIVRKVFIISDMIGSGVSITLTAGSENLSEGTKSFLSALNILTGAIAVTDLARNAKNFKTIFKATKKNTNSLPSKNDVDNFLNQLLQPNLTPEQLAKIGKNKIEETKVWLKHIEAEAITNSKLNDASSIRLKIQEARVRLLQAENIIDSGNSLVKTLAALSTKLKANQKFLTHLSNVKVAGKNISVDEFIEQFSALYSKSPSNSVKSLDDVIEDFDYLLTNHLDDFDSKPEQFVDFLNEFLQTEHKFKAGATSLEVIRNSQKYLPNDFDLGKLELEDFVSVNTGIDGEFRFDILWNATNNQTNKAVKILIDTKNYSAASNMFSDLGQFKSYLRQITNFNEMYFIQQGGRGVTVEQIINRLKNAIKNDKPDVFEANQDLFKSIKDANGNNLIDDFDDFSEFIDSDYFSNSIIKNCIKVTN